MEVNLSSNAESIKDLENVTTFLLGLQQMFPEIQVAEILQMCLVSLGVGKTGDC